MLGGTHDLARHRFCVLRQLHIMAVSFKPSEKESGESINRSKTQHLQRVFHARGKGPGELYMYIYIYMYIYLYIYIYIYVEQ
jgi:hypothetical protein